MKKIVVVEDNTSLLNLIKFNLLKHNFEVLTATNGKEGLKVIRDNNPDLIITDLMMPILDGLSMIKEIKKDEKLMNIPIIILTAKNSISDKIHGLEAGAIKYLYKPFEFEVLLQTIKEIKHLSGDFKVQLLAPNKVIFDLKQNINFLNEVSKLIDELTTANVVVVNETERIKNIFSKFYEKFNKEVKDLSDIWIKVGYYFSKEKLFLKIGWNKKNLFKSLKDDFAFITDYVDAVSFDDKQNSILCEIHLKSSEIK